jgi:hypothetical protein
VTAPDRAAVLHDGDPADAVLAHPAHRGVRVVVRGGRDQVRAAHLRDRRLAGIAAVGNGLVPFVGLLPASGNEPSNHGPRDQTRRPDGGASRAQRSETRPRKTGTRLSAGNAAATEDLTHELGRLPGEGELACGSVSVLKTA